MPEAVKTLNTDLLEQPHVSKEAPLTRLRDLLDATPPSLPLLLLSLRCCCCYVAPHASASTSDLLTKRWITGKPAVDRLEDPLWWSDSGSDSLSRKDLRGSSVRVALSGSEHLES